MTLSRAAIGMWLVAAASLIFTREVRVKDLLLLGAVGLLLATMVVLPRWDQFVNSLEQTGVVNGEMCLGNGWTGSVTLLAYPITRAGNESIWRDGSMERNF